MTQGGARENSRGCLHIYGSMPENWNCGSSDSVPMEAGRQRIRETLVRRASVMFPAAATSNTYWHRSYLQNHLWVNVCGVGAAGFAVFGNEREPETVAQLYTFLTSFSLRG